MTPEVVTAVLADWRTAPIPEHVRVMLAFLEKMAHEPAKLSQEDYLPLRAAGLSDQAIEDAILVSSLFHIITRLADALGFTLLSPEGYAQSGIRLWQNGYE